MNHGVTSQTASYQCCGESSTGPHSFLHGRLSPAETHISQTQMFVVCYKGCCGFGVTGDSACLQAAAAIHAVLRSVGSFLQSWED